MSLVPRPSLLLVAAALCASVASAGSNILTVPGTADVWLAGQPDVTILVGGFPGDDVAPANSPVLASTGLYMGAGSVLTFVVTGSVDYGGCATTTPGGDDGCGIFTTAEFFGISTYAGPINALIGIFVDSSVPGGVAPARADLKSLGGNSFRVRVQVPASFGWIAAVQLIAREFSDRPWCPLWILEGDHLD